MKLTCEEFRDLLADHLADELVVEVRESFELHLSDCGDCEIYRETYIHTIRITRKLPKTAPLPLQIETRLREALREYL